MVLKLQMPVGSAERKHGILKYLRTWHCKCLAANPRRQIRGRVRNGVYLSNSQAILQQVIRSSRNIIS